MIQLVSKELSKQSKKTLKGLQDSVNTQTDFAEQTETAKKLWKSKNGSIKNKKCFEDIKESLKEMCVSVEVCNYCENNEANDIEHIHPKSFFPEKAFEWTNYLLACKQCNTGYKLDTCYIIDNNNLSSVLKRGTKPPVMSSISFINPRLEDPHKYMLLDLGMDGIEGTWEYIIQNDLTAVETDKAKKTLDVLKLNSRATLLYSRKQAAIFYFERLDRLTKIIQANSMEELKEAITPYETEGINTAESLEKNKASIKAGYKMAIQNHQHPSVWYSIKKIQSKISRKWIEIFKRYPEFSDW